MQRGYIVATRYAKAIFTYASENGKGQNLVKDCLSLKSLLYESTELQFVLSDFQLSIHQKEQLLFETLGFLSSMGKKMLTLLVQNNRLSLLEKIVDSVIRLDTQSKGITKVKVTTATPLQETLFQEVTLFLENLIDGPIKVEKRIDTKVIGGLVINYEDLEYDASLSNRIKNLRQSIISS